MTTRGDFVRRVVAELLLGLLVVGAFVLASHGTTGGGFIATAAFVLLAAGFAGYLEVSAKRVWLHPLLIMWPELIALPVAFLTCKGFECGGVIAFLVLAGLLTIVLIGLSFAGFFIRRRLMRRAAGR